MTDNPLPDGGIDHECSEHRRRIAYERDPGEDPSEAVVRAVSSLTGIDPLELDPLYHVIDPEVLDAVFERGPEEGVEAEVTLQFNDCEATVTHATVHVRRLDE